MVRLNNKKIFHISELFNPYFGGRAVYLEKKLFKKFKEMGFRIAVLTSNFDNLPKEENGDGTEIYRINMRRNDTRRFLSFSMKALPILYRMRNEYDIIHTHGYWDLYGIITLFAKIFRKRMILHSTLVGSDDPLTIMNSYKYMKMRFKFIKFMDAFISISSAISRSYKIAGLPNGKLYEIPNGVDIDLYKPVIDSDTKRKIRLDLNLPEKAKIVIFVGAIIERKGVDILIESWRSVNSKIPDALLVMVGPSNFDSIDGDNKNFAYFYEKISRIVKDNHLRVLCPGKSDRVPEYLGASDLFVLPSRAEGIPNVAIEAMASGLPILVTEMDGIAYDLIESGVHGYVVHNHHDLTKRMIFLLNNDKLRCEMGLNARRRAVEKFDVDKICRQYIQLYEKLLQNTA